MLREPLLHFALVGAALFAVDAAFESRREDPRVIVVGPEVEAEARALFKATRGRDANADEWRALRQAWLDNEVLYREGLALGVDRGDTAIRERVIFKALSLVDADVQPPPTDEAVLREWFLKNRARYDEPPRLDFQEAVVAGGDVGETVLRGFVEALARGGGGELEAGLRVYKGRPRANVVQGYGEDFAKALETSPPGEWRALKSRDGWRAVRLEAAQPGREASFEALRGIVLHDWRDERMAEKRTAAVRALAAKYTVRDAVAAK